MVIGLVFLVLGVLSSWGFVAALGGLGDPEPAFEGSRGWVEATRGLGGVLFGLFAVLAFAVAWFFAGPALRRAGRRVVGRR